MVNPLYLTRDWSNGKIHTQSKHLKLHTKYKKNKIGCFWCNSTSLVLPAPASILVISVVHL